MANDSEGKGTWVAVTGSQDPYIFDLPHVLSLPPGFEFRFRYRHVWVHDDVRATLKKGADSFYGNDLIICFHSQDSQRVYPIRRCKIISVEEIGPIVFLRFSVGAFPRLTANDDPLDGALTTQKALDGLFASGRRLLGLDNGANLLAPLEKGLYFRKAIDLSGLEWDAADASVEGDDGPRQSARARAWATLAATLSVEKALNGVPLFHLLGFERENGACLAARAVKNKFSDSKTQIYGFELTEGERYRMRLLEWCERQPGEPTPRFRVDCDFAKAGLVLEGASNLVVGRYDVLEYTFRAEQAAYGEVLIKADPLDDDFDGSTRKRRRWPTIYTARVPVAVSARVVKLIGFALLVPVGLGLYVWAAGKLGAPYNSLVQILGLLLLGPFAARLEALFKMREGFQKWSNPEKK